MGPGIEEPISEEYEVGEETSTDQEIPVSDENSGMSENGLIIEPEQQENGQDLGEQRQTPDTEAVSKKEDPKKRRSGPKKKVPDFTKTMAGFSNEKRPISSIALVFIIVPILSILIAPTFEEEDVKAFGDNEESYVNPLIYLVLILLFTGLILMIAKYFRKEMIQWIILGAFFITMIYAFYPLLAFILSPTTSVLLGTVFSAVLTVLLVKHPEWYVVDATGIAVAVGVTSIIGISFAPGPILMLMIILAVYDAISVYKTKHMIDLADSVMEFNLPVLLVVPKKLPYSFMKKEGLKEQIASGKEREALFIGLGDIIFPSAFAVSLSVYLQKNVNYIEVFGMTGIAMVVAGVIIGTILGYIVLMAFVLRGKPQAGLPLLNGGAILGYLVPVLAVYHSLGLW